MGCCARLQEWPRGREGAAQNGYCHARQAVHDVVQLERARAARRVSAREVLLCIGAAGNFGVCVLEGVFVFACLRVCAHARTREVKYLWLVRLFLLRSSSSRLYFGLKGLCVVLGVGLGGESGGESGGGGENVKKTFFCVCVESRVGGGWAFQVTCGVEEWVGNDNVLSICPTPSSPAWVWLLASLSAK